MSTFKELVSELNLSPEQEKTLEILINKYIESRDNKLVDTMNTTEKYFVAYGLEKFKVILGL